MYRALLRVLPFDFRYEYGSEMEQVFREQREETERDHGFGALLQMWWITILDIFRMAPREHLSGQGRRERPPQLHSPRAGVAVPAQRASV